jgi:nucleoside-diphosphate-sugar epimerase
VFLTGSTGFVGSHAGEAFVDAGFEVRALARSKARAKRLERLGVDVVYGSLTDAAALAAGCRDAAVVVHLAALTHARREAQYERVNIDGTRAVLLAAHDAVPPPRRFVYLSSLAAAGPCANGVQRDPVPRPVTVYGRTKLAGEQLCLAASDWIEPVVLRAPAVYGPRDTDVYQFFRIARRGVIPVPNGPARPLQMVHVTDLAAALVRAVTAPQAAGVYHIAEARAYTWEEVGRLVGEAVGRRVRVVRVPAALISGLARASEIAAAALGRSVIFNRDKARELLAPGWLCDTEAARVNLGFEARIPLADGLRATAQWYRQQGWL